MTHGHRVIRLAPEEEFVIVRVLIRPFLAETLGGRCTVRVGTSKVRTRRLNASQHGLVRRGRAFRPTASAGDAPSATTSSAGDTLSATASATVDAPLATVSSVVDAPSTTAHGLGRRGHSLGHDRVRRELEDGVQASPSNDTRSP